MLFYLLDYFCNSCQVKSIKQTTMMTWGLFQGRERGSGAFWSAAASNSFEFCQDLCLEGGISTVYCRKYRIKVYYFSIEILRLLEFVLRYWFLWPCLTLHWTDGQVTHRGVFFCKTVTCARIWPRAVCVDMCTSCSVRCFWFGAGQWTMQCVVCIWLVAVLVRSVCVDMRKQCVCGHVQCQMLVIWSRWHFPHLAAHWLTGTARPPWISNWINPTQDALNTAHFCTLMHNWKQTFAHIWTATSTLVHSDTIWQTCRQLKTQF